MATNTNSWGAPQPVPLADGGTNATSMATTDGVVYFDGTRLVTTAVGTATNVLTSNGAGMAPTFQPAGALRLIQTQTATNSAALTFTGFSASYTSYMIILTSVLPVNELDSLGFQVSTDGGSTYLATGYQTGFNWVGYTNTYAVGGNANSTSYLFNSFGLLNLGNGGIGISGQLILTGFASSDYPAMVGNFWAGGNFGSTGGQYISSAITANTIQFTCSTGNISSGSVSLYGYTK